MSERRAWAKPEIEGFLAHERLSYQKIQLPFGLSTPGSDRPEMCDAIFRDVAGRGVLDIGSYLGYFCQEALRRGASSAHGLEADPEKVRQSNALAEMNGLAPIFTVGDVETFDLEQPYDVVLCLNVMHHLFDPIGVLLRLARATRHKLVLEVASINPRDGRKLGLGFLTRHLIGRLPLLYVAPGLPAASQRTNAQKYFFTPESIRTILQQHTRLFYEVEIVPSSFKQRFIVIAKRRKIRHLLVVSGPTSAGKSTFLRQLEDGSLPAEIRALLPRDCEKWPQIANDGDSVDEPLISGVVLRYDFLRPLASATHTFKRDQTLDLMQCSEKITVIVLRPEQPQLIKQYRASEIEPAKARRKGRRQRWHRDQLLEDYASPHFLASWYDRWRDFLAAEYPSAEVHELRAPSTS
jgi:2-polyprenyl-3-methyl-5-hydroxy-6-metoxy-1,4-benzoquinol methylase